LAVAACESKCSGHVNSNGATDVLTRLTARFNASKTTLDASKRRWKDNKGKTQNKSEVKRRRSNAKWRRQRERETEEWRRV
jgi:hypothetical protein